MATDNIDAIHDTFKEEIIKEELTEIKWSSENGVYKESPQMVGRDEKFHDLDSSNYKKNSRESKPSLTHFWKTPNFDTENIFAADDREVDKIEKNIKVDNAYEDHPEFIDDLSSFNAELKTQTLKSEDEIDIAYEDIKPEIDGNKLSGNKSHPNNIANIVPQESATDFCKNSNFDTEYIFAADDQEVDKIEKNIKVENAYEDHPEFIDDLSSINAELKTQTLKSEDDIDIVYEDIKPEMDGNKLSGNKPHPNNIANIVSQESAIDFGAVRQQNTTVEEDGTDVERKNEKQFQCNFSLKSIEQSSALKTHERTHAEKKTFKCNLCLKSFGRSYHLKTHERTHTGEKPYQCNFCSKSFTHNSTLKIHARTHTGEKPFQCNFCPKSFMRSNDLKIHERTHTGEKPFRCNICSRSFTQNCTLKSHERTHTREKLFQCNFCRKSFIQSSALKAHERSHTGEKPFPCKFCLKSFTDSSALKVHERTHTGEKPFQCNLCPKSFTQSRDLKIHERTHTGEKPFRCNICSKSFTQNNTLKCHERTHTGEKPFQCNFCTKSFSQGSALKTHERSHRGEKPFLCKICSKSFTQSSTLKSHERNHTGAKPSR